MKSIQLILRIYMGSFRIEAFIKSFLQYLLILLLLSVISFSLIEPMYKKRIATEAYQIGNFDVCVGQCTINTYHDISQGENISDSLGISFLFTHVPLINGDNQIDSDLGIVLDGSLEQLNHVILPDELYILKDDTLMKQDNAIVISYRLYSQLKAQLGDVLTWNILYMDYEYILAGVYPDSVTSSIFNGNINGFIPATEKYWELFEHELMKDDPASQVCSYAFFSFHDFDKGKQFIENDFYMDFHLYYKYGEAFKTLATEEDWHFVKPDPASPLWREYAAKMTTLAQNVSAAASYEKNSIFLIFIILLVLLIIVHNKNKETGLNLRPLAVLHAGGLDIRTLFWYIFCNVIFLYGTAEVIILLLYKYLLKVFKHQYLYPDLLIRYGAIILACILIGAVAAGAYSVHKLKKSNLSEILTEEERS